MLQFVALLLSVGLAYQVTEEELLNSDGTWHRNQQHYIALEQSCAYSRSDIGCDLRRLERDYGGEPGTFYSASAANQTLEERAALLELFDAWGGLNWRENAGWTQGDPCYHLWHGVTCNEHGRVIKLELPDNKLAGSLAVPALAKLTSLRRLDVSTSFRQFHAAAGWYANNLTGTLPNVAPLKSLEELELSGNQLSALSDDLYLLANTLKVISASRNLITKLPPFLSRMTKLYVIDLAENRIVQPFPLNLGNLALLRTLMLQRNGFTGFIDTTVTKMTKIRVFDVSHNPGITGEITKDIATKWKELEYFAMMNTTIGGYIASLCIDTPYCFRFMLDTHQDLTWAVDGDVPDVVWRTLELAQR